jgi:hypothetical protein
MADRPSANRLEEVDKREKAEEGVQLTVFMGPQTFKESTQHFFPSCRCCCDSPRLNVMGIFD